MRIYPIAAIAAISLMICFSVNAQTEERIRSFQTPSDPPFKSHWDNVPPEIRNRNPFKRIEWFYKPRQNEQGIFPKEFIDAQREKEKQKTSFDNMAYSWNNIGPVGVNMSTDPEVAHWGVVSGRVKGIAIHPTNPDIAYAGAGGGGIWKTTNGGQTWIDKSGGLNLITFGSIAIDPVNTNIIYAGTGEYIFTFTERFYSGDGLYKSTNGGDSWIKINAEFGVVTHFTDLEISPGNPNLLIAAIAKNVQNAYPNHGIWRSTNAGLNWTRVVSIEGAFDIAYHPTNPNIVYAATGANQQQGGFLISTDAGLTFSQSNSGLPPPAQIGRMQIDISASNPSYLYAVIFDKSFLPGGVHSVVYRSTNGGASWFQISQGVNLSPGGEQGFYDLCIAVSPVNPDRIFVGNVEFIRSDNGSTFSIIRDSNAYGGGSALFDSYTHVDHHVIKFAPSNPSVMYVGCDGGVFKSTNSGQSFFSVNTGFNTTQCYRLASHPFNADRIYTGLQDNGFISTINRGATPYTLNSIGDGTVCFFDYSNPNNIFYATFAGYFGGSTDNGLTWNLYVDPVTFDSCAFICPYWQHPKNPDVLYGCLKRKLYVSTNKGASWSFTTSSAIVSDNIYAAAQSPVDTLKMIVMCREGTQRLVRTSNGGYNWEDISGNTGALGEGYYMNIQADSKNANTFYLMKSVYSGALLLKTTNFGLNWTDISSDLPKVAVNDLYVDTANAGVMYVGNDFGVYRTTNSGGNWQRMNNGMPFVPVMHFNVYNYGGVKYLRAATFGRGLFELNINQVISVNEHGIGVPKGFGLYQNYPNPFNPVTRIQYDLPYDSYLNIEILDMAGRLIGKIEDGYRNAGSYQTEWNGEGFSSGIYLIKMTAVGVKGKSSYTGLIKAALVK